MRALQKYSGVAALACAMASFGSVTASAEVNDGVDFNVIGAVIVWSADDGGSAPLAVDFILDTGTGSTAASSGDADLIAGNTHTVVTGSLISTADGSNMAGTMPFRIEDAVGGTFITDSDSNGITDAADAFSPFGLTNSTNVAVDATTSRSSFYVASNTPFNIDARTQFGGPNTDFIFLFITRLDMLVTLAGDDGVPFGDAAQYPHSGGPTGGMTSFPNLWSLLPGRNVFTGNQRTAAARGSLADQSVRFDMAYSVGAGNLQGYDLSLGTFDFEVEVTYTVFIP